MERQLIINCVSGLEGELGNCLRDALIAAGCDLTGIDIPPWVAGFNLVAICNFLGLKLYKDGDVEIFPDKPVIVVFESRESAFDDNNVFSHAQYLPLPTREAMNEVLQRGRLLAVIKIN